MKDLNAPGKIVYGEFKVADYLPDQGSPKANWKQNSGILRSIYYNRRRYFMDFRDICQKYFVYLLEDGYEILVEKNKNCMEYKKGNLIIQLLFEKQGYEIYICVTHTDGRMVRAYDILAYFDMDSQRGGYQIPRLGDLEKGISYLSKMMRQIC